ncbi:hypothetical protein SDC9_87893 [bioreactor metagenome]|uniref:Uncharacterized protein n=1 Tax=bioreactor metagenome TaxID=1076179 RepID=A0A644ZRH2_9ZZZZ
MVKVSDSFEANLFTISAVAEASPSILSDVMDSLSLRRRKVSISLFRMVRETKGTSRMSPSLKFAFLVVVMSPAGSSTLEVTRVTFAVTGVTTTQTSSMTQRAIRRIFRFIATSNPVQSTIFPKRLQGVLRKKEVCSTASSLSSWVGLKVLVIRKAGK